MEESPPYEQYGEIISYGSDYANAFQASLKQFNKLKVRLIRSYLHSFCTTGTKTTE